VRGAAPNKNGKKYADKKIKDVRKQSHRNENYTYCGLMTDLG